MYAISVVQWYGIKNVKSAKNGKISICAVKNFFTLIIKLFKKIKFFFL